MKATLTIEVPDDFKKGNSELCNYPCLRKGDINWHCMLNDEICNEENCPLEIQEKAQYPKSCNGCEHYEPHHTSLYCHKCLDSREQENNQ